MKQDYFIGDEAPPAYNVAVKPNYLTIYKEMAKGPRTANQLLNAVHLGDYSEESAKEIFKEVQRAPEARNHVALYAIVKKAQNWPKLASVYERLFSRSLIDDLAELMPAQALDDARAGMERDISAKARKRINNSISWLLSLAEPKTIRYQDKKTGEIKRATFKVNFITLTLPADQFVNSEDYDNLAAEIRQYFTYSDIESRKTWISDQSIKAGLLNQFLVEAREFLKKEGEDLKFYFWRAEAQKTGNIHFHLVTDKYIPWEWMRKTWNRITEKMGFITRYRQNQQRRHANGFAPRWDLIEAGKWSFENQLNAYREGVACNWTNPNSTDVHSVKQVRNLGAYLSKYCTKAEEYRNVSGRKWFISTALSKAKSVILPLEDCAHEIKILQRLSRSNGSKVRTKYFDFCTMVFGDVNDWIKADLEYILKHFRAYREGIRGAPVTMPLF